jgi:hypothetical protein
MKRYRPYAYALDSMVGMKALSILEIGWYSMPRFGIDVLLNMKSREILSKKSDLLSCAKRVAKNRP